MDFFGDKEFSEEESESPGTSIDEIEKFLRAYVNEEADELLTKTKKKLSESLKEGVLLFRVEAQTKKMVNEYMELPGGKWRSLCDFLVEDYGNALVLELLKTRHELKMAHQRIAEHEAKSTTPNDREMLQEQRLNQKHEHGNSGDWCLLQQIKLSNKCLKL